MMFKVGYPWAMNIYLRKYLAYLFLGSGLGLGGVLLIGPERLLSSWWWTDEAIVARMDSMSFVLIGLALLLPVLGFSFLIRTHPSRRGIAVNAPWVGPLYDLLTLLFVAGPGGGIVSLHIISRISGIYGHLEVTGQGVLVIGSWFFLPALAVFTVLTLNFTTQAILIDTRGITVFFPGRQATLSWEAIKGLGLRETMILTGAGQALAARKMQTKLVVEGDGESLELFEPGRKRTKKKIVETLARHAPARLQPDIEQLAKEW